MTETPGQRIETAGYDILKERDALREQLAAQALAAVRYREAVGFLTERFDDLITLGVEAHCWADCAKNQEDRDCDCGSDSFMDRARDRGRKALSLTPSKAEDQAKALLEDVKIVNDMLWYPADGTYTEEDRFQAQLRIREKHLPALGHPSQWKGSTEYKPDKEAGL